MVVREGRHGKAKALQWILSHSSSAKLIAVRRVTQNKGSKTAGVDNVIWTTPKQKMQAVEDIKQKGLSTSSSQAYLYSQKERKTASAINSNNGRQGTTSTSLVNLGAHIGNVSGQEYVWFPTKTFLCRCHRAMFQSSVQKLFCSMGSRRRYKVLF